MTSTLCESVEYPNGVHEFIFYNNSKEAIDQLFVHITEIITRPNPAQRTRYLINSNGFEPPHIYIRTAQARWQEKYPDTPASSTAILHNNATFINVIKSIVSRASRRVDDVHFFKHTQREVAMVWLLEERKKADER